MKPKSRKLNYFCIYLIFSMLFFPVHSNGFFNTGKNNEIESGKSLSPNSDISNNIIGCQRDINLNLRKAERETYSDNLFLENSLKNYNVYWYDFVWFDAYNNGYNLGLLGDSTYGNVTFPFEFEFYGENFSTIYVSSEGWLSFVESKLTDWNGPSFPTSAYTYIVSPMWYDLQAQNNIYVWNTSDFVVIEFYNYNMSGDYAQIGTYEVVFYKTGQILFLYEFLNTSFYWDLDYPVGLNYGLDTNYYTLYSTSLGNITNFGLIFTTSFYGITDLSVSLEIPQYIEPDLTQNVRSTIRNTGSYNISTINVLLLINETSVDSIVIPLLNASDSYIWDYPWTPTICGPYNVTAFITPVFEEEHVDDNTDSSIVFVLKDEMYGFVEVTVLDDVTYNPIADAEVAVSDGYWFRTTGYTDVNGFCNITGLLAGDYWVDVYKLGYHSFSQECVIDYIGDKEVLVFYITLLPVKAVTIVSPAYGSTVTGGQVLITFAPLDNPNSVYYIEFKVNGEISFIEEYYNGYTEVHVPVFSNGSNTIEMLVVWAGNYYGYDQLVVNSVEVIPICDIEEGDYLNFRYNELWTYQSEDFHYIVDFNFTFSDWISPFVMNASVIYHYYNETVEFELSEYWIAINILNGLILEGSMYWWVYRHFFLLSGINCLELTGSLPSIGEKVSYFSWGEIYTLSSFSTWYELDVTILTNGNREMYVDVNYGTMVHYEYYTYNAYDSVYMHNITDTNIGPNIDFSNPTIVSPDNLYFELGSSNNIISWTVYDYNPDNFTIYKDGGYLIDGIWESGVPINTTLDGTGISIHIYILEVSDSFGRNSNKTITVYIVDTITPIIDSPEDLEYYEGTTGNNITWHPEDLTPHYYYVYLDGFIYEDDWWGGEPVVVDIDGLSVGVYNFTIRVLDSWGHKVSDTVIVTVIALIGEFNSSLFIPPIFVMFIILVLQRNKHRNERKKSV